MKSIKQIAENICHRLLTERATYSLYHYISLDNCIDMLQKNSLRTCDPETYRKKNGETQFVDGPGQRFISFTRNKNPREGYPVLHEVGDDGVLVRIELDGWALNTYNNFRESDKRLRRKRSNFKVKPIDWAYHDFGEGGDPFRFADNTADGLHVSNGKEWMMKSDMDNYFGWTDEFLPDNYAHPMSQAEDRLTSLSKRIPNATRYIRRIDVFYKPDMSFRDKEQTENQLAKLRRLCNKMGCPVYFYRNFIDFVYQK